MSKKDIDVEKFFKEFDKQIGDIVYKNLKSMSDDVRKIMKREALNTIDAFYNDYSTNHTTGKYNLFVPNHLLDKPESEDNKTTNMVIYWKRSYDLRNTVTSKKNIMESNVKKGYYRFTNVVTIDPKLMNQNKHRLPVADIFRRSFELGIHGYNKNDMDRWNNKSTNWYLPRSTANKSQPYKKRGAWHMEHWIASFYKKEIASGKFIKKYVEDMVRDISMIM